MKRNTKLIGTVVAGLGTCLLAKYVYGTRQQNTKLVTKKLAKQAVQSWEGEGGNTIDPVPRQTAI